jgi:hypothetical protein
MDFRLVSSCPTSKTFNGSVLKAQSGSINPTQSSLPEEDAGNVSRLLQSGEIFTPRLTLTAEWTKTTTTTATPQSEMFGPKAYHFITSSLFLKIATRPSPLKRS